MGTPICIPSQGGIEIGRIASMELNHKPVDTAKRGDAVAMKIEPHNATEATRLFGRHFTEKVTSFGSLVNVEVLGLSAVLPLILLRWTSYFVCVDVVSSMYVNTLTCMVSAAAAIVCCYHGVSKMHSICAKSERLKSCLYG